MCDIVRIIGENTPRCEVKHYPHAKGFNLLQQLWQMRNAIVRGKKVETC